MNKDMFQSPRMETGALACVKGFTLIELLSILSVFSFLSLVAIPSFSAFISSVQLATDHQKLQSLLSLARITSVSEGNYVLICRWDGVNGCTGLNNSSTTVQWSHGALAFSDKDNNRQLDAPDDQIMRIIEFSSSNKVTWNRNEILNYESDGSVRGGSNGTFTISQGSDELKLVISLTGRVRNGS